ncbi:protein PLANT CADMIUM RESISTANCE 2-like [Melia azedarach]|uniref:Protein PLANT CADMIUM RESISTANCE 2-like n=1 Tax=Melia azedarach TaxID=155640 RepID=A0ACC1XHF2_MELAZ|nr:protein PLANT CADMIUM RESISTANCE 2-like [Melia azedarach]
MYPNKPEATTPPSEKQLPAEGQWSTGFYDCCEDPSNCFITCFCPCITFGRISEVIDGGNLSCKIQGMVYYAMSRIGCAWLYGGIYRTKLRRHYSLPEAPCSDYLVHGCCCVCALTQEYRELKNRGIDPSIGWKGNVEKWNREELKPPIVTPGMAR